MQKLVVHDELINFQRLNEAFVGPQSLNSSKPEGLCRDTGRVSSRTCLQRTHSRCMYQGLALTLSFLSEVFALRRWGKADKAKRGKRRRSHVRYGGDTEPRRVLRCTRYVGRMPAAQHHENT